MLDRLLAAISVGFIRKKYQPDRSSIAANGLIHAIALDRESAGIVVGGAVNQQDGVLDLIGEEKRRHVFIGLLRFPEAAPLALKSEGRQSSIIRARFGDAGAEEIAMRQKVRGHERAIAVAADADPVPVHHAHVD